VRSVVFLPDTGLWDANAGAAALEKPALSLLFGDCEERHSLKQPQPSHLLQHRMSGTERQNQANFAPKDGLNTPRGLSKGLFQVPQSWAALLMLIQHRGDGPRVPIPARDFPK